MDSVVRGDAHEILVEGPVVNRAEAEAIADDRSSILRQVAEASVNVDLLYLTADGRLVLGGSGAAGIEDVIG